MKQIKNKQETRNLFIIEMIFENGIKLFLNYKRLIYVYDFRDNWQHYIEVQKVIDNYDKNYAFCIEGEGNAPPEDVGGEYGYDEFLEIISDKNNLEYENMMAWGENQGYKEFDIEEVNKKISLFYN